MEIITVFFFIAVTHIDANKGGCCLAEKNKIQPFLLDALADKIPKGYQRLKRARGFKNLLLAAALLVRNLELLIDFNI